MAPYPTRIGRASALPAAAATRRVAVEGREPIERRPERAGQQVQAVEGDRLLAALHLADELAAEPGPEAEPALRVAHLLAECPEPTSDDGADSPGGSTAHEVSVRRGHVPHSTGDDAPPSGAYTRRYGAVRGSPASGTGMPQAGERDPRRNRLLRAVAPEQYA